MLKRIISGICLAILMIAVFLFSEFPFVINAFAALISAMATYEVLVITKYAEGRWLEIFALILSITIPFAQYVPRITENDILLVFFVITVILFMTMILYNRTFSFEHICVIFCMSLIIPVLFTSMVYIRGMEFGIFLLVFVFLASWGADSGGYIFGMMFGTAKFTPTISPKKTIEGVFGGVFGAITACLCVCVAVDIFYSDVVVNYWLVVLYAAIGACFAIIGDLSASVIKRSFGVKDFGSLIPGHGGIMDRFDSVLFASPAVYILMNISPIFTVSNI